MFNTESLEIITNDNIQVLLNANPDIAFDKKYSRVVYATVPNIQKWGVQSVAPCVSLAETGVTR